MRQVRPRLVMVLAAAMLATTSGLAYAGSLPDAAQDAARSALARVGVEVPGPNEHADPAANRPTDNHGSDVAEVAKTITATRRDKGEEISAVASSTSQGHPQDDRAGGATADPANQAGGAPVETPNQGGTGTANEASDGASEAGTATADEASDGHSAAGSGNAGDNPPEDAGHQADDHRPAQP